MTSNAKDDTPQCAAEVWEPPGYWHTHQCPRRSKGVGRDGAPLCGTHLRQDERRAALGMGPVWLYGHKGS